MAAFIGTKVELQDLDQRIAKIEATLLQLADIVVTTAGRTSGSM
ncbi:MAG TPA: hypothetical protein VFA53_06430 [Xanthobacteraceae bacterium]|nr:hypothetical protein [Xanthobacteraceae bacterium]